MVYLEWSDPRDPLELFIGVFRGGRARQLRTTPEIASQGVGSTSAYPTNNVLKYRK